MTPGFTGADLANLMNEAALLAARKRLDVIGNEEVQEAFERQLAGPERKNRVMSEEERRTTAYHESGHALVGHVLKDADPVHKITIVSRGRALGYTMSLPEDDRFLDTRSRMLDQIAVLMGGRTAEEIFCNDITTGASNDLERATKLAREMVTRYGMSEALGAQVYGQAEHEVFLGRDYANRSDMSPETTKRIDDEVERIMRSAHERAREILEAHRAQMDTMAAVLLREETVEGELLDALLNDSWDAYVAQHPEHALSAAGTDAADAPVEAVAEAGAGVARAADVTAAVADEQDAPQAVAPAAPAAPTAPTSGPRHMTDDQVAAEARAYAEAQMAQAEEAPEADEQ
jgi:cell division protease FtsH